MTSTLLSIEDVAAFLGVTERTVYNKVRSGELPALKVGRLWRVRPEDLETWLRASQRPVRRGPYPVQSQESHGVAYEGEGSDRQSLVALLQGIESPLKRRLAFVGLLGEEIERRGWPPPVVVGGNAVEFYTAGDYATADIDLAGASEPVVEVLGSWGFPREGRHFFDTELGLVLEVPGSRLGPDQLAHVAGVRVAGVTAFVIGVEDLIVDRLCACKFWNDEESCMWAEVLASGGSDLDRAYLQRRAADEDVSDRLAVILERDG